jgi:hypothetical protein
MRKSIIALLAAMFCLAGWQADAPAQRKGADEEKDHYQLYRYAGRKWLLKRTPKAGNEGNDTLTSYHAFEVLNVWDDKAELSQTTLDTSKQPTSQEDFVITVEFKEDALIFKDPIGFQKGKIEKVKTPAGTFECIKWFSLGREDGDAFIWRSTEFPSLVVKQDDRFGTRELIEFTWVEGETGHKAKDKKKKKKKNEAEEVEDTRLFSTKGALWVHKTVTEKGERKHKSFDVTQYEVTKVSKEGCTLEISKLTQLLEKIKGEDPVEKTIPFDDSLSDHLQPSARARLERTEKRITEVGLFECKVYSYKDDEGRKVMSWYAGEWPGLEVRRVVSAEHYKAVTEIVKFEH